MQYTRGYGAQRSHPKRRGWFCMIINMPRRGTDDDAKTLSPGLRMRIGCVARVHGEVYDASRHDSADLQSMACETVVV